MGATVELRRSGKNAQYVQLRVGGFATIDSLIQVKLTKLGIPCAAFLHGPANEFPLWSYREGRLIDSD